MQEEQMNGQVKFGPGSSLYIVRGEAQKGN
jgi:hypothetical protein